MNLFGLSLHLVAKEALFDALDRGERLWIETYNPEILLRAQEDADFARTLSHVTYGTCDGFGLWLVARAQGKHVPRVTGVDLIEPLCRYAAQHNLRVGCVGDVSAQTAAQVLSKHTGADIRVCVVNTVDDHANADSETLARWEAFMQEPLDILFVGLGAPKQERWIERRVWNVLDTRLVMGVGGAFDMIAGTKTRAPFVLRKLGLEWLWRLALEPSRIQRIWRAVVVFPWRVVRGKH